MALIFMDGFDLYGSIADMDVAGWGAAVGAPTITTVGGRYNGGAVRAVDAENVTHAYGGGDSTTVVQFWFFLESLSTTEAVVELSSSSEGGGDSVRVEVTQAGAVLLRDTNGSIVTQTVDGIVLLRGWHYLEFKVSSAGASAACVVRIDGAEVINETGVDTGSAPSNLLLIGRPGGARFDDIVLMDGTGTRLNDFLGVTRISTLLPLGAGTKTAGWESTPDAEDYLAVDDPVAGAHDGDGSYIEATEKNTYTRFTTEFAEAASSVHAVAVACTRRHNSAEDKAYIRQTVRSAGQAQNGSDELLPPTYETSRMLLEVDPNGGLDWTQQAVDGLVFGVEHRGT